MALTKQQFIDIWTQLDALYGALAGIAPTAAFGHYEITTSFATSSAAVTALQAAGGIFADYAEVIVGNVEAGKVALAVNLAFVALGNEYVSYLNGTNGYVGEGEPMLEIAKPRGGAPAPGQSYHDNLLGNLGTGALGDRFPGPYAGAPIDLGGDIGTVTPSVDPRSAETIAFAGGRTYFDGNAGHQAQLAATIAWDLAHGVDADVLDVTRGGALGGSYYVVTPAGIATAYASLGAAVAAAAESTDTLVGPGYAGIVHKDANGDNSVDVGGAGSEVFVATAGNETINGAGGEDTYTLVGNTTGAYVDLAGGIAFGGTQTGFDTLIGIENVEGGAGDDTLFGDGNANTFFASAGTDTVDGRGGDDSFDASSSAGAVTVDLATGTASVDGGTTTLTAIENAAGGQGADAIIGTAGSNVLSGNGGNDIITGNGGSDTIDGGLGVDTVVFSGDIGDYDIAWNGDVATVTQGADTTTVVNAGRLQFDDGDVLLVSKTSAEFSTIQSAVNAAGNDDTILVAAGTYTEQVVVSGSSGLSIVGAEDGVVLKAPADVVQNSTSSSGRALNAVFTATNSTGITLENVTVDGDDRAGTVDGANANFVGIVYRNASGSVLDVDVTRIRDTLPGGTTADGFPIVSGNQRGVGVQVDNDTQLAFTMQGGSISNFQKNATVFNNAILDVSYVTVTGGGAQPIIAQNGIQVLNSTGTIDHNTITGIGYAGPANAYSGAVLAYGNDDLAIADNTITGAQQPASKVVGIFVFDNGPDNSGGSITGNTISQVDEGIDVSGGIQPSGILIQNNTVTGIDLTDQYAAGVYHDPSSGLLTVFDVDGTAGADFLYGAAGNDTLSGLGGDDLIEGRGGSDSLSGGTGEDTFEYNSGADFGAMETVDGGADTDTISFTSTTDGDELVLSGSVSNVERIELGGTADLKLDASAETEGFAIVGNAGDNTIVGSAGNDDVDGGAGTDAYVVDAAFSLANIAVVGGELQLTSGAGADTLVDLERLEFTDTYVLVVGAGGYATLGEAVAAADNGDTILILDGVTLTEQVTISGFTDLTILGMGDGSLVEMPAVHGVNVVAAGGLNTEAVIAVVNSSNVVIRDIKIDAKGYGAATGGNEYSAIYAADSSITVDSVTVTGVHNPLVEGHVPGNQQGRAIYVRNLDAEDSHAVVITNNTVTDYQKNGIDVRGAGSVATISGNTIVGDGLIPGDDAMAQNGIVLGFGATGTVSGNVISELGNLRADGDGPAGILIYQGGAGITVDDNDVTGATDGPESYPASDTTGIYVFATDSAAVTNNDLIGVSDGIAASNNADGLSHSGNTFTDVAGFNLNISGAHNDLALNVTGTGGPDRISGTALADEIDGGAGDDLIIGDKGADTITGGAGSDTIYGGGTGGDDLNSTVDTALYDAGATISWNDGLGAWQVDRDGNSETTDDIDTLYGIEKVEIDGDAFWLVDDSSNGGLSTIRSALEVAQSGQTILIAEGDYDLSEGAPGGQSTFSAAADNVTVRGSGEGLTTITGNPRIANNSADYGSTVPSGLTLKDMTLEYDNASGYVMQWVDVDGGKDLTLENVTFTGTHVGGFSDIRGADNLTLTNVTYGVTTPGGGNVRFLFGEGENITITGGTYNGVGGGTVINLFDSNGTSISGVTFSGGTLFLQNTNPNGTSRTSIEDNTFGGGGQIYLNQSSRVDVTDGNAFTVEGAGQGIIVSNYAYGGGALSDIVVDGNVFTAGTTSTDQASPISYVGDSLGLPATDPVTFTGNTVDGGFELARKVLGGAPGEDLTDYATSGADLLSGGGLDDIIDGADGDDIVTGGDGSDTLGGGAGDDLITGGAGNDTIDGGEGSEASGDVANYADDLSANAFSYADGVWTVTTVSEGVDELVGIEKVADLSGSGETFLLVGAGGYATLQEAVDAAGTGDTILLGEGSFAGALVDKPVSIIGAGSGLTTLTSGIIIDLAADAAEETLRIEGLTVANSPGTGIQAIDQQVLGTLEIADVVVDNAASTGMIVTGRQPSASYAQAGVQNVLITDSAFTGNGGPLNSADLFFYEYDGNATLTNVTVIGDGGASFGIQFAGFDGESYAQTGFPLSGKTYDVLTPMGDVVFTNVDVSGSYGKVGLYIQGYTDTSGLSFTPESGNTVDVTAGWGIPVFVDPMADQLPTGTPGDSGNAGSLYNDTAHSGATYDLSGLHVVQSGLQVVVLDGTTDDDAIVGSNADDVISGFSGDDVLSGGLGDDTIDGGAGEDTLTGGQGDDTYFVDNANDVIVEAEGEGNDTVVASSSYTLAAGVEVEHLTAAAGTDPINLTGNAFGQTITGNAGDNILTGGEGNDTLIGDEGDDIIDGGAGRDLLMVDADFSDFSYNVLTGRLEYNGPGPDLGDDLITNVEVAYFTDVHVRIVGNGGFASLQEAIDDIASSSDDGPHAILVAPGSYVGNAVIADLPRLQGLQILGVQAGIPDDGRTPSSGTGESTIEGQLLIQADGVTVDGLRFTEGGSSSFGTSAIAVAGANTAISNSLFYRSGDVDGDSYRGIEVTTAAGGTVTVTENAFAGWATGTYINPGVTALVTGNDFSDNFVGLSIDGPVAASDISDNDFTDNVFEQIGVGAVGDIDVGVVVGANVFSGTAPEVGIYPLGGDGQVIGGTAHDDVFNGDINSDAQTFSGGDGDDVITGGAGNDTLSGDGGDDLITGGAGSDVIVGGAENDTIVYGASSEFGATESVDGGDGTDTIEFNGSGTDQLVLHDVSGVENLELGGSDAIGVDASAVSVAQGLAITGNDGANAITGTTHADTIIGGGGADTITGSGGGDTVYGGTALADDADATVDTASYSFGTLAWNGSAWTINGDTLHGIEKVTVGSQTYYLVDQGANGGFSTIQGAVTAAASDDIVLVANGSYTEDLTVTDRAITIQGVNPGTVTLNGQISVSDVMEGDDTLAFRDFAINAAGKSYGITVRSSAADDVGVNDGKVVLDGMSIANAREIGLFYAHPANGSTPLNPDTIGSFEITDSVFADNGQYHTGARGQGHVNLFGFNGDLTVADSAFHGPAGDLGDSVFGGPTPTAPGTTVNPHKAISISGLRTGTPGEGGYVHSGDLVIDNVEIDGNYASDVVSFYHHESFASVSITGLEIDARGPWGLVNFDSVGGDIDLSSGINGSNSFPNGAIATLQGLADANGLQGTAGNDLLLSRSGTDDLTGGGGNDNLVGGGGNDTAHYENTTLTSSMFAQVADGDLKTAGNQAGWSITTGGADGTDIIQGIEIVAGVDGDGAGPSSGRVLLVGNGGFGSIQSAVDAAIDGDTILVASGLYAESVTVDVAVTLLGANAGVLGSGVRGAETTITGGIRFVAGSEGARLDGVSVTGADFKVAMFLDRDYGVIIAADDVTIVNSVLTGVDGNDTRPFGTMNGAQAFEISGNLVTGWDEGAYLVDGTAGLVEDNVFDDNGNGVLTESMSVEITGNTFSNSGGGHVVPLPYVNVNIEDVVHDNVFLDQARPISVYLNGSTNSVNGSDVAETITAEYVAGPVALDGGGGDDVLIGSVGDDTLTGGTGADLLIGGLGADTASYAGSIAPGSLQAVADADPLTVGDQAGWQVTSGTEGTDTLVGMEVVDGLGAGRIVLVGSGGFASLQAAIDEADAGDTILIAAGAYAGDATIGAEKTGLTILGAQAGNDGKLRLPSVDIGESTIDGRIVVLASDVTIDGLRLLDGSPGGAFENSGIHVQAEGVTVRNSTFYNTTGFGGGARGIATSVGMAAGLTVEASAFEGWATGVYVNGGSGTTISASAFNGNNVGVSADAYPGSADLLVEDNTFTGNVYEDMGIGAAGGSWATSSVTGNTFNGVGVGVYDAALGTGTIAGNTFNGTAGNDTFSDDYLASERVGGNTINGAGGTDTADYSFTEDGVVVNLATGSASGGEIGSDTLISIENVTTGSGNDTVTGSSADNVISTGGGDDIVNYAVGGGNDTVDLGGGTADKLVVNGGSAGGAVTYVVTPGSLNVAIGGAASGNIVATGAEKLALTLGNHGDTVNLSGNLATAGLLAAAANTSVTGGTGNDVVNASGLASATGLTLSLGGGDDTYRMGRGNDAIDGGTGARDLIDLSHIGSITVVDLSTGTASGADVGSDTVTGFEDIRGGSGKDFLTGNASDNIFYASAGDDVINGGAGNNTYDASVWSETTTTNLALGFSSNAQGTSQLTNIQNVFGGSGDDFITGTSVANILRGGGGNDTISGGDGADTIDGGANTDILNGDAGNDILTGGLGTDTINGGAGDTDIAVFAGTRQQYTIAVSKVAGVSTVTVTGPDGTDTLTGVEYLRFVNGPSAVTVEVDEVTDFNMNTSADILYINNASQWTKLNDGASPSVVNNVGSLADRDVLGIGDFNGDGKDDVLLRAPSTNWVTYLSGADKNATINVGGLAGYEILAIADFNGNGRDDVLIKSPTGWVTYLDGADKNASNVVGSVTGFTIKGIGDFDGDGRADILVQSTTGWYSYWNGGNKAETTAVGLLTNQDLLAIADFNGDGKDDLLIRSNTGWATFVPSADKNQVSGVVGSMTGLTLLGVGDFDGDGRDDMLIQKADGFVQYFSGAKKTFDGIAGYGGTVNSGSFVGKELLAIDDYTGDGKDDLLVRDTASGVTVIASSAVISASLTVGNLSDHSILNADFGLGMGDDLLIA